MKLFLLLVCLAVTVNALARDEGALKLDAYSFEKVVDGTHNVLVQIGEKSWNAISVCKTSFLCKE